MAIEPLIEPILEHVAPDLSLVPDWAPTPDPIVPMGPLGQKIHWSDVYDYVAGKIGDLFHGGVALNIPTTQDVQNYVNGAVGEAMKGLSGFIDQNAAMTVQAASLLDGAITNLESNALNDFRTLSQRIDNLDQGMAFIAQYIVPTLEGQIANAENQARLEAQAAQQNAIDWGLHHIFAPLYEEILKVQPAIDQGVAKAEAIAHSDAAAQVAKLATAVGVAITPMRAAIQDLATEAEQCTTPMCESLGPKTNLGKLLKGLNLALGAGLLAEIATAKESDVANAITRIASHAATVIDTFETDFIKGGKTLAGVVTAELANVI